MSNLITLLILSDMYKVLLADRHNKNFVGFQGKARCGGLQQVQISMKEEK